MLSYKLDFSSCIIMLGFGKSSEIIHKQVDVLVVRLLSKNQALSCKLTLLYNLQCVTLMSHEQRLITKEHIAMYSNLILWFNPLNTQVLSDKTFKSIKLNSYCSTTTQTVFISFTTWMACPPLKLKCSNVQMVKGLSM